MRRAVALPVRIAIKDVFDETCTQLLISAPIDSGARPVFALTSKTYVD